MLKNQIHITNGYILELSNKLPKEEGYYFAKRIESGLVEPLRVRFCDSKSCLVVDVCGQKREHSEELWRYQEGWLWSKQILTQN